MRSRVQKLFATATLVLATPLAWPQQTNPYVLGIDRMPYALAARSTSHSAAAGGTAPAPIECKRPAPISAERIPHEVVHCRERDYEQRISQAAFERDAWKRRAQDLENEIRATRALPPPLGWRRADLP